MWNAVTDVPGIKVGHYTDKKAATGCTVILCEEGAMAGVDISGSAPGTRDTDILRPLSSIEDIYAILLSGGSAFGLNTTSGVMRYLEEKGCGHKTRAMKVPLVPTAILYDLAIGDSKVRPGDEEGYKACLDARNGKVAEGSVGAGTGAVVGKILGTEQATKTGIGTASGRIGEIVVGALVAVNAWGDVINYKTGKIIAGPRNENSDGFLRTSELLKDPAYAANEPPFLTNTVIGVVATNASLNKLEVNKLAQMAQAGVARTIDPVHTTSDGDVLFAISLGKNRSPYRLTALGSLGAELVAKAILRAVREAEGICGIPASKDILGKSDEKA
jgi:L-aminopeptidase/D-esterase-like protein